MYKQELLVLPFPSTAVIRGPVLCTDGGDLLLSMDFDDDGQKRSASLRFAKQRAFRKRSEIYCTGWHVSDTYDTVCEVKESDWVGELRNDAVPDWRDRWVIMRHLIYIDSFGCLEVVAESALLNDKNHGGT